jgi:WD40 repeat protein/mono/diheme cytochrome c family protein
MKRHVPLAMLAAAFLSAAVPASADEQDQKPVSYTNDLLPIFKASCGGCHNPKKKKGKLDMSTYETFKKGGKAGAPWVDGDPDKSLLVTQIIPEEEGEPPAMPEEGDPLTKDQVDLIKRWIKEGAKDDTPKEKPGEGSKALPEYPAAPVVPALAYSPDGRLLAVPGYHEILLHNADGSGIVARLAGESSQISGLAFSADGSRLAACGGSPAQFGEIQVWDVAGRSLLKSVKLTDDMLFGVSFSPDAARVAFCCTDKSVRMIELSEGKEVLKFDGHSEWSFGTLFTLDGKRLLTGSRDRAMKLIDASNGQHIDDVNKLLEPVLCIARHPKQDIVVYGGGLGTPRIYRISDNQQRTAGNNDTNLILELERMPGAVRSVAFSPDGETVAVAGVGSEVRLHSAKDGKRVGTLAGHEGAVFAAAFSPDGTRVATGGHDGQVRLFDAASGELVTSFVPVPLKTE